MGGDYVGHGFDTTSHRDYGRAFLSAPCKDRGSSVPGCKLATSHAGFSVPTVDPLYSISSAVNTAHTAQSAETQSYALWLIAESFVPLQEISDAYVHRLADLNGVECFQGALSENKDIDSQILPALAL